MDSIFREALEADEEHAGYQLRDADLDEVAHYFEYNADLYAAVYLG